MTMAPMTPTIPSAVIMADDSGDNTKDHSARNMQSKVLTLTKTMWKLLRDMSLKSDK